MNDIYKTVLLDHFHNPRNKGDLESMTIIKRGSNPRCGDDIEVGFKQERDGLITVRFRGRGCSICLASASMMSETLTGIGHQEAKVVTEQALSWLCGLNDEQPMNKTLVALEAVRNYPARVKCATLAWKAFETALIENAQDNGQTGKPV